MKLNLSIVDTKTVSSFDKNVRKFSVSINRNIVDLKSKESYIQVEILNENGEGMLDDIPKYFPVSLLKELKEGQTVNVMIKNRFSRKTIFEENVLVNQLFAENIEPLFGNKPFHEIIASI